MKDEKIAIIGTGMMGMSLAVLFTGNGYDTTVLATKEASVLRGRNSYNEMYSVLQERGLVSETQMARCAENLHSLWTTGIWPPARYSLRAWWRIRR